MTKMDEDAGDKEGSGCSEEDAVKRMQWQSWSIWT